MTDTTDDRDPLGIVGTLIDEKYRVEKLVGEGGFAVVYRAEHVIWKRPVALKLFNGLSNAPLDQRRALREAFIQEGALLTELSTHTASIVQARDVGTYTSPDGQWLPYMVLEWLTGASLEQVLREERRRGLAPWTLAQVLPVIGQVALALDVAHHRGIAHRDVKPDNLFVLGEPRSGKAVIKILDFGVAKMMTDNAELKAAIAQTGTSVASFTPQYGAPEQFTRSFGATGPWTDVFALALVALELLKGGPVLEGSDLVQLAYCAADLKRRPTPRALGLAVSDAVEGVFRRALAVDVQARYASAGAFWRDLENAAASAPLAPTLAAPPQLDADVPATERLAAHEFGALVSAPPPRAAAAADTLSSPSVLNTAPGASGRRRPLLAFALSCVLVLSLGLGWLGFSRHGHEPGTPAAVPAVGNAAPAAPLAPAPPAPPCPERMLEIPKGQFFMGSDAKDAPEGERPSHNVQLDTFCIDVYEVTAREYKACSDRGQCRRGPTEVDWPKITEAERELYSQLCTLSDPQKQDHPVNCLSWHLASAYCSAQGKRLPSEAEWEYATRGPDGRIYPWGDDPPTAQHLNACGTECVAWGEAHKIELEALYPADDGFPTTAPVGQYPLGRSRFGPFDVVGNVWEWVADWHGPYSAEDKSNPTGPKTGAKKVIRGGGFNGSYASWLRPSFRYAQDPNAMSHGIGLRCVKNPAR